MTNDEVRSGLDAMAVDGYRQGRLVELDFVSGHLAGGEPYRLQVREGLA